MRSAGGVIMMSFGMRFIAVVASTGIVAAIAVLRLGSGFHDPLHRSNAAPAAPMQAAPPSNDPSAAIVENLQRRITALESRNEASTAVPGPAPSPAPPPQAAPRPPPPSSVQLDRLARTEARDRAWADAYERDVRASLAATFKDDRVTQVSCATSICRIAVEHPSQASGADFIRRFWTVLPEGYAGVHFQPGVDGDGKNNTVLHLIRKGYADSVLSINE
jgi:hypothetical protein